MERNNVIGEWKKEKILGTGGFGIVVLWINTRTSEPIALKECRWGHDAIMTTKHRQRWKLEVDIMRRLSHPSVVKTFTVPTELDGPPGTTLPLMAMEYCNGGDLRKMLSRPESCCGLADNQVRLIMRHIVSAVAYLHSMRIIHRDLKPENIVMQEKNGHQVYKLIDLGYAKELDQSSLCTSFVGTLQYLAPELFLSQSYTCTVDFWSLGLVTHEIMTGQRPFLPNLSPAQWIPVVRLKSSDDISAFVNSEKKVEFSTEICPFNQISRFFKTQIEEWLKIMLEFDPGKRGRRDGILGFEIFQKIIDKKVLHVFCVNTGQVLFFEPNERTSVADLQASLSVESGIFVEDQLLLLPKGIALESAQRALACWTDPEAEEVWPIFLLCEKDFCQGQPVLQSLDIPKHVQWMMQQPKDPISFEMQRIAWREAIFLSQQITSTIQKLTQGYKSYLLHLLRRNSVLHKSCVTMQNTMYKLKAKMEFFQESLQTDLKMLQEVYSAYDSSLSKMQNRWKKASLITDEIEKTSNRITELEEKCNKASVRTTEPQKSPYARSKHSETIIEMHNAIISLFGQLKKRTREERAVKYDNSGMVRLLCVSIQFYEAQSKEVCNYFKQIRGICQEVYSLVPEVEGCLKDMENLDRKLTQAQEGRQKDVWNLQSSTRGHARGSSNNNNHINTAYKPQTTTRDSNDNSSTSDYSSSVYPNQVVQRSTNGRVNPFNNDDSQSSGESSYLSEPLTFILGPSVPVAKEEEDSNNQMLEDWNVLLRETARSSLKIRKENADLRNSLGSMISTMARQQEMLLEEDEQMLSIIDIPTRTKP